MPKRISFKIPYGTMQSIISNCPNKRTQALIAFQFALAGRSGELAKGYTHIVQKKKRGQGLVKVKTFESEGLRRDAFRLVDGAWLCDVPNFKNKKKPQKLSFIAPEEAWLFAICNDWLLNWKASLKNKGFYVFDIRRSRIRGLIDAELKKVNPDWHSHLIRHSRASWLGSQIDNPYYIQEALGHDLLETSRQYVSVSRTALRKRFAEINFGEMKNE